MIDELIVFCFQRTGSSVFGKWLTDAGYVDFKEIYALEFDFKILDIPVTGEAITEEYVNHCNSLECSLCCSFENKYNRMIEYFKKIKTPDKFLYKMFLSWHAWYCQQDFYKNHINDKNKSKILLIRKDLVDWVSSMALQNAGQYLGHGQTNNITMQFNDKMINDAFFGYQILLEFVDELDYIVIYEDAIRDKTCNDELEKAFNIPQTFDSHVNLIDNPFNLKKKHVSNFSKFEKILNEDQYIERYNNLLEKLKQKYVVNGNAKLIGKL